MKDIVNLGLLTEPKNNFLIIFFFHLESMDIDSLRNIISHNVYETFIMVLQKLENRFENCHNRTAVSSLKVNVYIEFIPSGCFDSRLSLLLEGQQISIDR